MPLVCRRICLSILYALVALARASEPTEGPPLFFASDLLTLEQLESDYHRVRPVVQVRDFGFRFSVESDFGNFEADGSEELDRLLGELQAIATLKEVSQSEAFAKRLSTSLSDPLVTTWGVARRPVATVVGLPAGISRYITGKLYQVRRGSTKTMARFKGKDDEEAPAETVQTSEEVEVEGEKDSRIVRTATSLSKRHLGYNSAKRRWAQQLRVDPYSDNAKLQEELDRIAWSSSLGGFAGDFVNPGSQVISYAGKARELVWEKSPAQLELENEKRLKRLDVSKEQIRQFADFETCSLTEKTQFCILLETLGEAKGAPILMELLFGVEDAQDVQLLLRTIELLANYNREVARISEISLTRGLIVASSSNGYKVLPIAADYLHWTSLVCEALLADELGFDKREVWISGQVSPIARMRLNLHGWQVFDERTALEASGAAEQGESR